MNTTMLNSFDYQRLTVKELSRIMGVSLKTASKVKKDILERKQRKYMIRKDLTEYYGKCA